MNENKGIVAPNRSISTRVGIKGPGESINQIECGKNWCILIEKKWILIEEIKQPIEEQDMVNAMIAKPEPDEVIKEEKKPEPRKPRVKTEKVKKEFGAQKIETKE